MKETKDMTNFTAKQNLLGRGLARLLEYGIRACLDIHPELVQKMDTLHGKAVKVEITSLGLVLFFVFSEVVEVLVEYEGIPDTSIRGQFVHFIRLARHDHSSPIHLDVSGDMRVGESFQKFLVALNLDWEELLARASNDVVAHEIGRGVRALHGWHKRARGAIEYSVGEYLREEIAVAVTRHEVDTFIEQVDQMRDAVDRLEAKMTRRGFAT